MSSWSCPHDLKGVCERVQGAACDPGMRGCVLHGRFVFAVPETAATMGYRGAPEGLLDADTNLRYGVKYLRGAWLVARRNPDRAVMWYSKGYYYEAKRMGLLEETGLRA